MKIKFNQLLLLLFALVVLASCGPEVPRELNLSTVNGELEVFAGESIQFQTDLTGSIEYQITLNEQYATISTSGLLMVNADAPGEIEIKVVAKFNGIVSNEVTITVMTPIQPDELILVSSTLAATPGQEVTLSTNLDNPTYRIVEGADYAKLEGNILTINPLATVGGKVVVIANIDNLFSNEVAITIEDILLTGLEIVASSTQVTGGNAVGITVNYLPTNTTQTDVELLITNDYLDAYFDGMVLYVNSGAALGEIKIIAKYEEIVSNELTITVVEDVKLEIAVEGNPSEVLPGSTYQLVSNLMGATYYILQGVELATINDLGQLVINDKAAVGTTIIIYARLNDLFSQELVLIVGDIVLVSIEIGASTKNQAIPGETLSIDYSLNPLNTTQNQLTWEIIEGSDQASLNGHLLQILETALVGSTIKVVAKCGEIVSNEFVVTVMPLPVLELTADKTNLQPGETITLNTNLNDAFFKVLEGSQYVVINNNQLTVKADATVGANIMVVAYLDNLLSDPLTFTIVDILLESIDASASTTTVFPGSNVTLTAEFNPLNTTQTNLVWVLKENYHSSIILNGNILEIGTLAPLDLEIVVFAQVGSIISNEVTIKVIRPSDDFLYVDYTYPNQNDYFLMENHGTGSEYVITVDVTDINGRSYPDATVSFEVISGNKFVSIREVVGYSCFLKLDGHGDAIIVAKVSDKTNPVYIDVKVIKTPELVMLSEYLNGKQNIDFKVAINQPLAFTGIIIDPTAAQDLGYLFYNPLTGETGDVVGTYDYLNQAITFYQEGPIEVTVTTLSQNSHGEKTQTFIFNTNVGVNVGTWEELKAAGADPVYANQNINIIVTNQPSGYNNYDIVPLGVINNSFDINQIIGGALSIYIYNPIALNGNGYLINLKNMPKFNLESAGSILVDAIIEIKFSGNISGNVILNDLAIEGNVTIDGKTRDGSNQSFSLRNSQGKLAGVNSYAISIGEHWYYPDLPETANRYNVSINNLMINYVQSGLRINRALEGSVVSNSKIENCYIDGIYLSGSILNFHNIEFGRLGGANIDFGEYGSKYAGEGTGNQNQKITFTGSYISNNFTNLQSAYLQKYSFGSASVSEALGLVIAGYYSEIMKNLQYLPFPDQVKQAVCAQLMSNLYATIDNQKIFNLAGFFFHGLSADYSQLLLNYTQINFGNGYTVISMEDFLNNVIQKYMTTQVLEPINTTDRFFVFSIPVPAGIPASGNIASIIVVNPNFVE